MIEKTFITQKSSKKSLKELKKTLVNELNMCNGIITEMEENNNYYLLLAFEDKHKDKILKIINQELLVYYTYYKKIEFFKKQLVLENINPVLAQSFVRALVRFDQNLDNRNINKALFSFDTINLDSFFSFKLSRMNTRWKELIKLTNENSISLLSERSFEDLLKFLINNLEPQIMHIEAIIKDNVAEIFDTQKHLISKKKIKAKYAQLWLLMTLIKFSPKSICIKDESQKANLSLLLKFFSKKIELVN